MKRLLGVFLVCVLLAAMSAAPVFGAEEAAPININTATVEELVGLKGVGEKYAQAIVQYREENGPFESPEDIQKVPGIGARTFEANAERISIE